MTRAERRLYFQVHLLRLSAGRRRGNPMGPWETPREDEYIKVMCPAEAMKLKRRRYVCSECCDKI